MSRDTKFWLGTITLAFVLLIAILVVVDPAGAATCDVRITAPANLQQRLNAAGDGKVVCLSGTFSGYTRPQQGQTIIGGKLHGSYDLHAGYVTLRNVEVYGSDVGVRMGPHAWVDASYLHDNSQNGISGYANNNDWWFRITDNRIIDNGSKALEGHASAGVKLLALSKPNHAMGAGATVTGNTVIGSHGNGLWLDQSSSAATLANNTIRNSTRHGIRCEICGGSVVIRSNTIDGSGYDGIDVTSSGVVSVLSNTVTNSHDWGITVHGDWRAQKTWPNLGDETVGWKFHSVTLSGNHADGVDGCDLAAVKC